MCCISFAVTVMSVISCRNIECWLKFSQTPALSVCAESPRSSLWGQYFRAIWGKSRERRIASGTDILAFFSTKYTWGSDKRSCSLWRAFRFQKETQLLISSLKRNICSTWKAHKTVPAFQDPINLIRIFILLETVALFMSKSPGLSWFYYF